MSIFMTLPSLVAAAPPIPARIGGTVTVDGVTVDAATGGGYRFTVTRDDGTDFSPVAESTGVNSSDWYLLDIPLYDSSDQPGGAVPGDKAVLHVFKDGFELKVISPVNGVIIVGGSGSTTQTNIQVVSEVKHPGILSMMMPAIVAAKSRKPSIEIPEMSSVSFSNDDFVVKDQFGRNMCNGNISTSSSPYWPNNNYKILDAKIGDVDGDGKKEIVTIGSHKTYYPGQVAVFNHDCNIQGRYWNPGWVYTMVLKNISGSSAPEIIVGATNNDYFGGNFNVPTIFTLDGKNVSGEAPPNYGSFPPGSQLWYDWVSYSNAGIKKLTIINGIIRGNTQVDGGMDTNHCVDYSGNLTACY